MVGLFVEVKVNQGSFITKSYVVISVIVLMVNGLGERRNIPRQIILSRWLFQTIFISTQKIEEDVQFLRIVYSSSRFF